MKLDIPRTLGKFRLNFYYSISRKLQVSLKFRPVRTEVNLYSFRGLVPLGHCYGGDPNGRDEASERIEPRERGISSRSSHPRLLVGLLTEGAGGCKQSEERLPVRIGD